MPDQGLKDELEATRKELFNLRFQKAMQQLSESNAPRKARRKLARIQTVIRERELARQAQGQAG